MMVSLFTATKLVKSTDLLRLYPWIPSICLEERYIPVFVQRYGCCNDLNQMTNLYCCHGLEGVWPGSSFLLVFDQAFAVQYSVSNKIQNTYLKHFITFKLLEQADFLGWRRISLCGMKWFI